MIRIVEELRPKKLDEMILPPLLRQLFEGYVKRKQFPHLLLAGITGCGKTTISQVLCNELGIKEPMIINASKDNGVDVIRNKLEPYCAVPDISYVYDLDGGKGFMKKVVILDEFEKTSPAFKESFKGFVEDYEKNVVFIITTNSIVNFIAPLMGRFMAGYINYDDVFAQMSSEDKKLMKLNIGYYMKNILEKENIEYSETALIEITDVFFPDIRSSMNELERIVNLYGNAKKYIPDVKYDVRKLLGMGLKNLEATIDTVENKFIFYRNVMDFIIESEHEDAFIVISKMIDSLKFNYSKTGLIQIILMMKKLYTQK